jgi:hypothetical protein
LISPDDKRLAYNTRGRQEQKKNPKNKEPKKRREKQLKLPFRKGDEMHGSATSQERQRRLPVKKKEEKKIGQPRQIPHHQWPR